VFTTRFVVEVELTLVVTTIFVAVKVFEFVNPPMKFVKVLVVIFVIVVTGGPGFVVMFV